MFSHAEGFFSSHLDLLVSTACRLSSFLFLLTGSLSPPHLHLLSVSEPRPGSVGRTGLWALTLQLLMEWSSQRSSDPVQIKILTAFNVLNQNQQSAVSFSSSI